MWIEIIRIDDVSAKNRYAKLIFSKMIIIVFKAIRFKKWKHTQIFSRGFALERIFLCFWYIYDPSMTFLWINLVILKNASVNIKYPRKKQLKNINRSTALQHFIWVRTSVLDTHNAHVLSIKVLAYLIRTKKKLIK